MLVPEESGIIPAIHPPKGRRPWLIPENAERHGLRYLSWGRRRYGHEPLPATRQAGYVYFLLVRGRARWHLPDETLTLKAGSFFILHPSVPMGWSAPRGEEQEILCWIWRRAPSAKEIRPASGSHLHWRVTPSLAARLQLHHRSLRGELARRDAFTAMAVAAKQTELDILLARELTTRPGRSKLPPLLQQAVEWIETHPGSQRPVADLCDRLDISPATLGRLTRTHLRTTPLELVNRAKIEFARRALAAGSPVKAVAHDLGYRHAHDFSRFFRARTGTRPAECLAPR